MAITNVGLDTSQPVGEKLDPEMRAEIEHLAPGLETGEVTANELAQYAVTSEKLYPGAVDNNALGADAVESDNFKAGAVDTRALGPASVTAAKAGIGIVAAYDASGNPVTCKRVYLTAAQFAALTPKDPNTDYFIS